jgi:hypothetical protein
LRAGVGNEVAYGGPAIGGVELSQIDRHTNRSSPFDELAVTARCAYVPRRLGPSPGPHECLLVDLPGEVGVGVEEDP